MFTLNLKFPWIFVVMLLFTTACTPEEVLNDAKVADDYVDQNPVSYKHDNTIIPNQYIVFLKKNSPSGLYPELANFGKKGKNTQREVYQDGTSFENQVGASSGVDMRAIGSSIVEKHGISSLGIKQVYNSAIPGFLINMSPDQAKVLMRDPDVKLIEEDRILALEVNPLLKLPFIPSDIDMLVEQVPYGVERVGGTVNVEKQSTIDGKKVWVVDTGIDTDHPDLNVDLSYSRDFTLENDFDDKHGHGTHVAGIIGARENSYGVSGVAAGAKLVSVKVLDSNGMGTVSGLVNGLNHINRYCLPNDVVNISLGGENNDAVKAVMNELKQQKIFIVIAAGNMGVDSKDTSPANIDGTNIFAVGAIDWNDLYTSYSNFGKLVDFAAPGHGILSSYPGGKYAYMSGTSMAAPHITGIMLLTEGKYKQKGTSLSKKGLVPIIGHQ